MLDTTPVMYYALDNKIPTCGNCRFWRAEADGLAGECRSPDFCELVWSKYNPLDPIMTKGEMHCDFWEQAE